MLVRMRFNHCHGLPTVMSKIRMEVLEANSVLGKTLIAKTIELRAEWWTMTSSIMLTSIGCKCSVRNNSQQLK